MDALGYVEEAFALAPLFDEARRARLRQKAIAVKRRLSYADTGQGVLAAHAMY